MTPDEIKKFQEAQGDGYTCTLDDGTVVVNCIDLMPPVPCTLGRDTEGNLVPIDFDKALAIWSKNPEFKAAYERTTPNWDRFLSGVMLATLCTMAGIIALMLAVQIWLMF